MRWYFYFFLWVLGLVVAILAAHFQSYPGYMDADYYYAGGVQLARGYGFNEMILWNYLDNPQGLPHASHAYWMPLASIIAAMGMVLTRTIDLTSARLGFIVLAAFIPPLTSALAFSLSNRRDLALASGFFALFSAYYYPYLSTTETFGIYMILGAVFFLLLGLGMKHKDGKSQLLVFLGLGIVSGMAHLTRADGFLWLAMASLTIFLMDRLSARVRFFSLLMIVIGYLLIMTPWFIRNIQAFGTPLAPGSIHALWLTNYDQLYSYPASKLTMDAWLDSGWSSILSGRLNALKWNLQTAWAVQGIVFLLPFILLGAWVHRKDLRIKIGIIAWSLTFLVMTLVFPFAGSRGGFFHSGAALQPLWWVLAPVGIELAVKWVEEKRRWRKGEAFRVFILGFIGISLMMSIMIYSNRVLSSPGWGYESKRYRELELFLQENGASRADVAMVGNPAGFFIVSERPAIAVPSETLDTVIMVAQKYGAKYLILEGDGTPLPLKEVFDNPQEFSSIHYLGEVDGARVFTTP